MTENTENLTDGSSSFFRLWVQETTEPKEDTQQQELTEKDEQKGENGQPKEQKVESVAAPAPVKAKVLRPIPAFEEHSILPNVLHDDAQANLISVPLAEVDQFYGEKETFIVLNGSRRIFRFSTSNALKLFNPSSSIRRHAISIAIHRAFAYFLIAVILINFYCIANTIPRIRDVRLEPIFLAIYFLEFLVKIVARGFVVNKFSYLRDPWNWLDLIILIAGIWSATFGCGLKCVPLLGEFRILKIGGIAFGLRRVINQIVKSLHGFQGLYCYVLYAVSLVALVLLLVYQGTLTQACVRDPVNVVKNPESLTGELWNSLAYDKNRVYRQLNGDVLRCGNVSGAGTCPAGFVCLQGVADNPNYGFTNFDTYGWAYLSTIRLFLKDYCEDLVYNVVKSNGPVQGVVLFAFVIVSYIFIAFIWAYFAVAYLAGIKRTDKSKGEEKVLENVEAPIESATETTPTVLQKCQKKLLAIVSHPIAAKFIIVCIVLNTICMALDQHDQTALLEKILRISNWVFLIIFVVEAILKIIAVGPRKYFSSKWNVFDFIIVVLGVLELCIEGVQGLSILRTTRLLRPIRLGRVWPTFNLLLSRIVNLTTIVLNHSIVLLLIIFVFILYGTNKFGRNYVDNKERLATSEIPRWNFTDNYHSFMVVVRALCGEWIESMWDCLLVGQADCICYFLALITAGNLVVIHLFLALLVSGNDAESCIPPSAPETDVKKSVAASTTDSAGEDDNFLDAHESFTQYDETQLPKDDVEAGSIDGAVTLPLGAEEPSDPINQTPRCFPERCYGILPLFVCCDEQVQVKRSRIHANRLLANNIYGIVVLVVIVFATLLLAEWKHVELRELLNYIEWTFILVLFIDFGAKFLANGVKSCLTNIWHVIDLINLIVAALLRFNTGAEDWLICLLVLRSLSVLSRCQRAKIVILVIVEQIKSVAGILVVCGVLWAIFAIAGVQLYAGRFFKCVDSEGKQVSWQVVPDIPTCIKDNYTVINSDSNFDNFGNAVFCLIEVASFKGWIQIIYDAIDSREFHRQPIRDINIYQFGYFVLFIVCGVFCTFNLIIGAIVAHINRTGRIAENYLTEQQIERSERVRNKPQKAPLTLPEGSTPLRARIFNLVTSEKFTWIAFAILLSNCFLFTFYYYQSSTLLQNIHHFDLIFILLFAIEVGLRLFGLRGEYFKNGWNIYDLIVLALCLLELVLVETVAKYFLATPLLRIIRLGRYEYLILNKRELQPLRKSYEKSTAVLVNIILTMLVIELVYGIIGIYLFRNARPNHGINDVVNFKSLRGTSLLLNQLSTAAGWDGVISDITNESACTDETACASKILGTIYIVSYIVICFLLILNFHLVLILEYLSHSNLKSNNELSDEEIRDINDTWEKYDATLQHLPKDKLSNFLDELTLASICKPKPNEDAIKCLGIPENDNHLLVYNDVLAALTVWKVK